MEPTLEDTGNYFTTSSNTIAWTVTFEARFLTTPYIATFMLRR